MVSTAAFHARVRGSVPGLGGLKETKLFLPHPRVKVIIVGSLRDREVACSASDRQGSNFESCVWRTVSSQSSHHPQEVLLAQFSLYVHKGGLKPDSFHFFFTSEVISEISGKFAWVFQKVIHLDVNSDINSQPFTMWFCRHHWMVLRPLPCKFCKVCANTLKVINEVSVKFAWVFQYIYSFRRQFRRQF